MPTRIRKRRRSNAPRTITFPDTLRTSERSTLNRCRQRWSWSYNERLSPKREAPALRFGTLIHRALEHYYGDKNQARRRPIHPAKTFARLYEEELEATAKLWPQWRDEDDTWYEYKELGEEMLTGYMEKWKHQDREYIVLAVEQRFYIPILVPKGQPELVAPCPTTYVGTLDRILFHIPTKRLLFGDYKTTKNDPTKNPHLTLDEQAGSYWAYGPMWLKQLAPKELLNHMFAKADQLPPAYRKSLKTALEEVRFDGILYDFMKKSMPDTRDTNAQGHALNKDGSVSLKQPGQLFHREIVFRDEPDRRKVLHRIYEDARDIGRLRTGELAIKKSPDRFICIGCQFIDMCELHEVEAHGWEEFRDTMYTDWDPYTQYWIDADELW